MNGNALRKVFSSIKNTPGALTSFFWSLNHISWASLADSLPRILISLQILMQTLYIELPIGTQSENNKLAFLNNLQYWYIITCNGF